MPSFWDKLKLNLQKPIQSVGELFKRPPAAVARKAVFNIKEALKPIEIKSHIPENIQPYKSQAVETMAQLFGGGKRPSTIVETLEKPAESFEKYLGRAQEKRLAESIKAGKKPPGLETYFTEQVRKEVAVSAIEMAKGLARFPFKMTKQFKYHPIFYKEKEPELKLPVLGEITTYGEDFLRKKEEYRKMGVDDKTATVAAMLRVGGEAIMDVTILASWLESGAKALARKSTPQLQERIAAYKLLGEPKSPETLKKSFNQLANQFHPDRIQGNVGAMQEINNAYNILKKGGLPNSKELLTAKAAKIGEAAISPISKIMELPRPKVILPFEMLPEQAGYVPEKAYQPFREIRGGLQTREVPMKPVTSIKPETPRELEPLIQEARKYKSAKEFVKKADFYWQDRRAMGGGEPFAEATINGKYAGAIIDSEAMPIPKTARGIEAIPEEGKYGVVDSQGNPIGVFDTELEAENALKSQLTGIYNQAVKKIVPTITQTPLKLKTYIDANLPLRFRGRILGLLPENLQKESYQWFKKNAPEYIKGQKNLPTSAPLHEITDAMETVVRKKGISLPDLSLKGDLTSQELKLAEHIKAGGTFADFYDQAVKGIKPEYAKTPVEAFKVAEPGIKFDITEQEAEGVLLQFFDENETKFLTKEHIWAERPGMGVALPAYGRYADTLIEVVKSGGKVSSQVTYHESFHAYMDLFVPETEKKELLRATAEYYKIRTTRKAEEFLADGFAEYLKTGKTFSERIRVFFVKLINQIRKWIGKESKILKVYDDLIAKKRPTEITKPSGIEMLKKKLEAPAAISKVSLFDEPRTQLGWVLNKINEGKTIPKELEGLVEDFNQDSLREIGEDVIKKTGAGKYKILFGDETFSKEALVDIWPAEDYKNVDWKKLQKGSGIDIAGYFAYQGNVQYTKNMPAIFKNNLVLLKDAYDDATALITTLDGDKTVSLEELKLPPKTLSSEQKTQLSQLKGETLFKPEVKPKTMAEMFKTEKLKLESLDDIISEEARTLQQIEEGARGGMLLETKEGYRRATEHSQAYRQFFKARKRAPRSLNDWKIIAEANLNAGISSIGQAEKYADWASKIKKSTIDLAEIEEVLKGSPYIPTVQTAKIKAKEVAEIVGKPELKPAQRRLTVGEIIKDSLLNIRSEQKRFFANIKAIGGVDAPNFLKDLREIAGYPIENKEQFNAILATFKKPTTRRTLAVISEIAPRFQATQAQKSLVHIAAAEKGLSERQYKRLAKIYTGKTSTTAMTREEAKKFIDMLERIVPGFRGVRIPRTTALLPPEAIPEIAGREFKEVGLGKYVLSPKLVFKKIGTIAYQNIFEPTMKALALSRENISGQMQKVNLWQKKVGALKIKKFIPGLRKSSELQSERMFNWLNTAEKPPLPVKELEVVGEAKNLFDRYADRLDELRAKQGEPPVNRRENYITNLINAEIKYAIIREGRIDSSLFAILDDIVPKQVFDPFLLARQGKLPIQKNFWKALRAYINVTEKKLAFDPLLPQIQAYIKYLPSQAQRYAKWFVNDVRGRPGEMERAAQVTLQNFSDKVFGNRKVRVPIEFKEGMFEMEMEVPRLRIPSRPLTKIVSRAKMLNYMSFIGGNLRTMFVNLTQPIGTAANLPGNVFKNMIDMGYGYTKVISKILSRKAWKQMRKAGILTEMERLTEEELGLTGVLGDLTMWNMKISEFMNRVSSAYAGKKAFARLFEKRGMAYLNHEALVLGIELSDLINFKYGLGETPKMFRNPIGNLYYQYNTFALKQAELLGNMAARTLKKGQVEAFLEAAKRGKGVEYLEQFGPPTRTALLKYILWASTLVAAATPFGIDLADVFYKGAVPSNITNFFKGIYLLAKGDWSNGMTTLAQATVPPAVSGVYKLRGLIPMEKQIRRLREGETFLQKMGFEEIKKQSDAAAEFEEKYGIKGLKSEDKTKAFEEKYGTK